MDCHRISNRISESPPNLPTNLPCEATFTESTESREISKKGLINFRLGIIFGYRDDMDFCEGRRASASAGQRNFQGVRSPACHSPDAEIPAWRASSLRHEGGCDSPARRVISQSTLQRSCTFPVVNRRRCPFRRRPDAPLTRFIATNKGNRK